MDGCTDETACNYIAEATEDDGSCLYPGDTCDDNDDTTINDVYSYDCVCREVDGLTEAESTLDWSVYPSPTFGVLNPHGRCRVGWRSGGGDLVDHGSGPETRAPAGQTQLDVHELAPGVYFLTLCSPAMAATTRRFVVGTRYSRLKRCGKPLDDCPGVFCLRLGHVEASDLSLHQIQAMHFSPFPGSPSRCFGKLTCLALDGVFERLHLGPNLLQRLHQPIRVQLRC